MSKNHEYAVNNLRHLSAELGRTVILPRVSRNVMAAVIGANLESNGLLLEGSPGTGKTKSAKALAGAIGGEFKRVQGTADLLPFDIIGSEFYNQQTGKLEFRPGPIFANVFFFDEINRAAPKTQSALLEGMQEGQVSVGGTTHKLPQPHFSVATQNPSEISQGTYPLPLANLDRFAASVNFRQLTKDEKIAALGYKHTAEQVVKSPGDMRWSAEQMDEHVSAETPMLRHVARVVEILDGFKMVDSEASVLESARILPNTIAIAKSLTAFDGAGSGALTYEVGYPHVDTALQHVLPHRMAMTESHVDSYGATPQMAISSAIHYSRHGYSS